MSKERILISGLGLGAGLMFLLDSSAGRRRRALVRDKLAYCQRKLQDGFQATSRDLKNRGTGLLAGLKSFSKRDDLPDQVLVARVRSKLGRVCSHPRAIEVTVSRGDVTLSGPVLAYEMNDIISAVSSVRGVKRLENRLEGHQEAGQVSGLQGPSERLGERTELMQAHWSPASRFLVGAVGTFLTVYGLKRAGVPGSAMGLMGAAMLTRGLTNLEMKRLSGLGAGTRAVDLNRSITIKAPVERVFAFWKDYQNFPRFMSHVREVRQTGDNLSHWVLNGPASVSLEWDAAITAQVVNQLLEWKSQPGSTIQNAGVVRFEANPSVSTTVHIRMSYNPPGGALGAALASLLGSDPKKKMDEDLVRMKLMIEENKVAYDVAENPLAV
jgi:uncharacterized membrane protein